MRARFLLLTLAGMLTAGAARADDTSSLEGLLDEEVVTTASRSPEQVAEAPAFSRSISADEIRRYGIRSLDEALNFLGVGIRTTRRFQIPTVGARGVSFAQDHGNHELLLVDGHTVNDPLYGSAPFGQGLALPLELVDHIEVVLGPGSTMYGSNAVLAVVNVVTKSASSHKGLHVAAELSPLYDGRGTVTGGHSFDLFGKKTDVIAGATYYRQDGPAPYFARQETGAEVWGGQRADGYFSDVAGAYVRATRERLEVTARASQFIYGDPSSSGELDKPPMRTNERRASVSLRYGVPLGSVGEASARVYGDYFGRRESWTTAEAGACSFPGTTTCLKQSTSAGRRVGVELLTSFDWLRDGRLTTRAGVLGTVSMLEAVDTLRDLDTGVRLEPKHAGVAPHFDPTFAAHGEQSYRVAPWLAFTVGARLDVDPRYPAVASPRAAVTTHPWMGGTLKALYAHAFRAPNDAEVDSSSWGHSVPSQGLRAEEVDAVELVAEQRVSTHRVAIGLFAQRLQDAVDKHKLTHDETVAAIDAGLAPGPRSEAAVLYQLRSDHTIRSWGFTSAVDSSWLGGDLRLGASFTGAVAGDATGDLVPAAPRVFGNARASYDLRGGLPTLAVAASFAGKTVLEQAYHGGLGVVPSAPPQLDLRGTLSGPFPSVRGLSYRAIASYAFQDRSPFAIGPSAEHLSATLPDPVLAPVQRWQATLGLQYDF
jgi:outer membrane receptor protein involved in Fe transport